MSESVRQEVPGRHTLLSSRPFQVLPPLEYLGPSWDLMSLLFCFFISVDMEFIIHFLKKYLFLALLGVSCGMWDLCCGMWDLLLWRAGFSLVEACGLQSTWAL